MGMIRILFIADSHLGFDLPLRPRVRKKRRGEDFFENYRRALKPAFQKEVDVVVHGGDLLFRSRVPASLVDRATAPLKELGDMGVDVFLVPGNHERSRIPYGILCLHPRIHIFSHPRTFIYENKGLKIGFVGFPFQRGNIRRSFLPILKATRWQEAAGECRAVFLCVHHCFEGATVGPSNYTFKNSEDVIRHEDIPENFTAVLSGHIHRSQILTKDLQGRSLKVPVFYPGSLERTSFAEKNEHKGFMILKLVNRGKNEKPSLTWKFHILPCRPMVRFKILNSGKDPNALRVYITRVFESVDPHSVVSLDIFGPTDQRCSSVLRSANLRQLCPPEMSVSVRFRNLN
jgi:DNA repair exonuclease SbcCD nuclease subunit